MTTNEINAREVERLRKPQATDPIEALVQCTRCGAVETKLSMECYRRYVDKVTDCRQCAGPVEVLAINGEAVR